MPVKGTYSISKTHNDSPENFTVNISWLNSGTCLRASPYQSYRGYRSYRSCKRHSSLASYRSCNNYNSYGSYKDFKSYRSYKSCVFTSVVFLPMPPKIGAVDRARDVAKLLRKDADASIPTHHKKAFEWAKICACISKDDWLPFFQELLACHIDEHLIDESALALSK